MNINCIKHRWVPVGLVALMALALVPAGTLAGQPRKSPVKVFILAGQSNMEGQGTIRIPGNSRNGGKGTLEYLVKDPATAERFKHTVDKTGNWVVPDDVWIWYLGRKGGLSASSGAKEKKIGPEFQIGHVMGQHFDNLTASIWYDEVVRGIKTRSRCQSLRSGVLRGRYHT